MKFDYSNSMKLRALIRKYEYERDMAIANLQTYFENSVGVGDHSDLIEAMDEQLCHLAMAEDKLKTVIQYFANIQQQPVPQTVETPEPVETTEPTETTDGS
jgi:hypothetical protein